MDPDDINESALLKSFKKNDRTGLKIIYNIFYPQLFEFANRILHDPKQCEDILSESFVVIWQKRKEFKSLKSVGAYLYTTTRNNCFNYLKKAKKAKITEREFAYLVAQTNSSELTDAIRTDLIQYSLIAAQQLPKEMKKVFELIYINGFSAAETAEQLKLSLITVKVQKRNAIKKVREILTRKGLLIVFF